MFDRAAACGEFVPDPVDIVLVPPYLRALWGRPPADPVVLVDRLFALNSR
ncbi:hypothetical protein [Kutzneria sp. NPDC052558]